MPTAGHIHSAFTSLSKLKLSLNTRDQYCPVCDVTHQCAHRRRHLANVKDVTVATPNEQFSGVLLRVKQQKHKSDRQTSSVV